jgi:hypothetical protein
MRRKFPWPCWKFTLSSLMRSRASKCWPIGFYCVSTSTLTPKNATPTTPLIYHNLLLLSPERTRAACRCRCSKLRWRPCVRDGLRRRSALPLPCLIPTATGFAQRTRYTCFWRACARCPVDWARQPRSRRRRCQPRSRCAWILLLPWSGSGTCTTSRGKCRWIHFWHGSPATHPRCNGCRLCIAWRPPRMPSTTRRAKCVAPSPSSVFGSCQPFSASKTANIDPQPHHVF